jgi:hypothetical protein
MVSFCRWFHLIDLKFKEIRYMFIFNLNVVFTTYFSKMAPTRVQNHLQEQDFTGRNLLQRGLKQLRKKMREVWSAD